MSYSINHEPNCSFDNPNVNSGNDWYICSCPDSPLEKKASPEYDVQRWNHQYWWEDGMEPVENGPWVLAWEAEIHEREAVQQAILKCIAAVEDLHPEHCFPSDHPYQMKRAAIAALRALQEKS